MLTEQATKQAHTSTGAKKACGSTVIAMFDCNGERGVTITQHIQVRAVLDQHIQLHLNVLTLILYGVRGNARSHEIQADREKKRE